MPLPMIPSRSRKTYVDARGLPSFSVLPAKRHASSQSSSY